VRQPGRHTRGRRVLAVAALGCLLTPLAADAAAHRGQHRSHRQSLSAYSPRYGSTVAPGVELTGYTSGAGGASVDTNVVTVDLSRPGVSTAVLVGRVTDTAAVSTLAARAGAVAAVNGDYYAIGGSQAPQGPVVRDGLLLKGTAAGQLLAGVGTDGVARLARVFLQGSARWGGGGPRPLDCYNSDLAGGSLPRDAVAVLDGGWGDRPLTFTQTPRRVGVVAVDRGGRVLATWPKAAGQRVPPGGLLLVGTGRWSSVAGLPRGSRVSRSTGMTTDAPVGFRWGLGVGLQLVRDGVVTHHYRDDSDPHAARTALAWRDGGRTLLVLTAERRPGGASGASLGQGVNEIADELSALGATDAVLLDGGGSTTLVARPRGGAEAGVVGALQDGRQRAVPVGIGVFVPRGSGRVLGLLPSLDAPTAFPGTHRRVTVRGFDEWYGAATVPPGAVRLGTDTPDLVAADRPGLVRALQPGVGRVQASAPGTAPGATGPAVGSTPLRVLGPLAALSAPTELRLAPGSSTSFRVLGTDGRESAPIDGLDLRAQVDARYVRVRTDPDGAVRLSAPHGTEGAVSTVTLRVAGRAAEVLVRNGFQDVLLLEPAAAGAVRVVRGTTRVVPLGPGVRGLRVQPGAGGATAVPTQALLLPAGAQSVRLTVAGDGRPHAVRLLLGGPGGERRVLDLATATERGVQRLEAPVPAPAGWRVLGVQIFAAPGPSGGALALISLTARV